MKTTLFGALALVLTCSLTSAQPAPGKTEAQLLFDKCRAAYAGLKSYRGTTRTSNLSLIDGAPSIYAGSAKISFQRPGLLRVDGKLAGGGDFSILGNAKGSWYRWPIGNGGQWTKIEQLDMAIGSMTGVAASAPTTIPSLLTQPGDSGVFAFSQLAKIDDEEPIDGQMCHKITAKHAMETTSWWIDKKTLLLRRIVGYTSEAQSAAKMAEVEKAMKDLPQIAGEEAVPKIDMRFVSRVEEFEIEAINEAVDEKLFAPPELK
ncbi:MAG TPA: hypothetical protein VF627_08770 [Abditibacterium sp.]|jgi:hypothetical protein